MSHVAEHCSWGEPNLGYLGVLPHWQKYNLILWCKLSTNLIALKSANATACSNCNSEATSELQLQAPRLKDVGFAPISVRWEEAHPTENKS
jgi:hypothetical protein